MKLPILTACIICAVTAGAYAIDCFECAQNDFACSLDPSEMTDGGIPPKPCPRGDDVCILLIQHRRSRKDTQETSDFYDIQCGKSSECDQDGSFTTIKFDITFSTRCCNTSGCVPALLVLPPYNDTRNGVTCPACLSETKQECIPRRAMECTGEEKYCISCYRSFREVKVFYSYGCGTENTCRMGERRNITYAEDETLSCTRVSSVHSLTVGSFLWCPFSITKDPKDFNSGSFLCAVDEDVCMLEGIRTLHDGVENVQYVRRCGKSHECSRKGSISSSKKTISINTTCCYQSQCRSPGLVLAPVSNKSNGQTCRDCYISSSHLCKRKDIIQCTGDEKACIQYIRTVKQDFSVLKEVLHGCASRSICEAGPSRVVPMLNYGQYITTEVICNKGRRLYSGGGLSYVPAVLIVIETCLKFSSLMTY